MQKVFVNNGEVTYVKSCKIDENLTSESESSTSLDNIKTEFKSNENNVLALQTIELEESFVTEMSKTPSTPASEKTISSHSSSIERVSDVDMSQFELYNTDNMQVLSQEQATSKFGSIFSFIKNSLLRNEVDENELPDNSKEEVKIRLNKLLKILKLKLNRF